MASIKMATFVGGTLTCKLLCKSLFFVIMHFRFIVWFPSLFRREDAEVKHEDGPKHSVGVSESAGGDKDAVNLCSSTNRVDSSAQGSPANTSLCHLPTSESGSLVQNNSYSSPTMQHNKSSVAPVANEDSKVDLPVTEKPKSNGKSSSYSEAHTALNSFEAVLGALTRTKESIGRATRIAIDCAKFGVSSKV